MDAQQHAANNALAAVAALNDVIASGEYGSAEQESAARKCLQDIGSFCTEHAHIQRLCQFVRDRTIASMAHPEDMQLRQELVGAVDALAREIRVLRGDEQVQQR